MTNLTELLKDAPNDLILYSVIFGDCKINVQKPYIHCCSTQDKIHFTLNEFGQMTALSSSCNQENTQGECILFPDAEHRTWNNWEKPWEDKIEPEYDFEPFQKVIVRDNDGDKWTIDIFCRIVDKEFKYECMVECWKQCLPYNETTKQLIGTTLPYEVNVDIPLSEDTKYNIEIRDVSKCQSKLQFTKIIFNTYNNSLLESKNLVDRVCETELPYILPFPKLRKNEAIVLVMHLKDIGVEAKFI